MKILIIDNNIMKESWGCENFRHFARLKTSATLVVRRAPERDLPKSPRSFDRIIVSGSLTSANEQSPWVDELLQLIRSAVDLGKPFLGVCFGHQMLARALGGETSVRRSQSPEYGWSRIELIENNKLVENLPREFYSFSAHQDEVAQVPPGARVFARSERCGVQGFEISGKPIYGIQFHPEKRLEECEESLARWKKGPNPRVTLEPSRSQSLYRAEIGETLFRNFFE